MHEIKAAAHSVRELLDGQKYSVDYYQRDYKWGEKQVRELIEDLAGQFEEFYDPKDPLERVEDYGRYFLGSIITSRRDGKAYIVDGQQRLTTLTILLILLNNLQQGSEEAVEVSNLVFSKKYGKKSFNIDVDDRIEALDALLNQKPVDPESMGESARNIVLRYQDMEAIFPEELQGAALPYFINWLIEKVHLVEIAADSDNDAYTIFETMNDRGLSLSPTDMLKGFLLANITDTQKRNKASEIWRDRTRALADLGAENDSDFLKAWLRSQYAESIRDTSKNAKPLDFDRIGTEFHRWVREHADQQDGDRLTLTTTADFFTFIERDFDFYAALYRRLLLASSRYVPGWERVLYNAKTGNTHQYMLLLAPLVPGDPEAIIHEKVRLVSTYVDIILSRRTMTYRQIGYKSLSRPFFQTSKAIRGMTLEELGPALLEQYRAHRTNMDGGLEISPDFAMHMTNGPQVKQLLARLTEEVEVGSGLPSEFLRYITLEGKQKYEVEHIWANIADRHSEEFPDAQSFHSARNRLGGLLLLPKQFNASYGALTYEQKLPHYRSQNLLAMSLHHDTYRNNPGFERYRNRTGLPFQPHEHFDRAALEQRGALYCAIAERIWDPELLVPDSQ